MNKKYKLFNIIAVSCFVLIVISNLFISNGEYSELENRYLQDKPEISAETISDRTYMNEIEEYSSDQLMFRNFLVKMKAFSERLLGKKENNGVCFSDDGYLIEKPAAYNEKLISENIRAICEFAETEAFNVSVCVIPQTFEILKSKLPMGVYTDDVSQLMKKLDKSFKDAGVTYADPTVVLTKNQDEYIYYRTDHHQTSDGSYLIYELLGDVYGYDAIEKKNFECEEVSGDFYGTTYSKGLVGFEPDMIYAYKSDINKKAETEFYGEDKKHDSVFFEDHLDKKDKYSYFLDGNHAVTILKGGKEGGTSLAVFKDSYAHGIAPFLINEFENIHLIDMRYFNEDPVKYLAENDLTDVLFLYGSSTFMTDTNIAEIADYKDSIPKAKFGLVKESAPADDSYFEDAVFLGDSLTMGFQAYSGLSDATFICRTSMSIGGVFMIESDGTSMVDKVKSAKPAKIYCMLGVNEYLVPSNKEVVMDKYASLMDRLIKDNPDATIYIQSILPYSKSKEARGRIKNEVIYDFDETIRQMAEERQIYYIDVFKSVIDSEGYLADNLTGDGVHLNKEGCELWADYLKTHTITKKGMKKSASTEKTPEFKNGTYKLESIGTKVKSAVEFEEEVGETTAKMLVKTHNINPDIIKNAYGFVGGGATAEEIALFEVKDKKNADEVKKLLNEYIKQRKASFESYIPKEIPKLNSALVYSDDKLVALVIAKDVANAEEILKKEIK